MLIAEWKIYKTNFSWKMKKNGEGIAGLFDDASLVSEGKK